MQLFWIDFALPKADDGASAIVQELVNRRFQPFNTLLRFRMASRAGLRIAHSFLRAPQHHMKPVPTRMVFESTNRERPKSADEHGSCRSR